MLRILLFCGILKEKVFNRRNNNMKNDLIMDCIFDYEGETISARIKNDNTPIRMVRGVEMMSGFFDFYDKTGYCGTEAFYENFEDMSPVRPHIAKKYYIDMIKRKGQI